MPVTARDHLDGGAAIAADSVETATSAAVSIPASERTNLDEADTISLLPSVRDTGRM
jgi:hypothetical protein